MIQVEIVFVGTVHFFYLKDTSIENITLFRSRLILLFPAPRRVRENDNFDIIICVFYFADDLFGQLGILFTG